MNTRPSLLLIALAAVTLIDCKKSASDEPQATACQPPSTLVAKSTCETNYTGVLLLASDYQLGSSAQFEYYVYPQKDTLSSDISANNKGTWANASNNQIVVPENVLVNAPKFVVRVSINCSGKLQPSYFSFVRRPVANSTCNVWGPQKL